jgi:hypothetical protein
MAMLMGLLMETLFGIFQKKYMKMKKQCNWYAFLVPVSLPVSPLFMCNFNKVVVGNFFMRYSLYPGILLFQCAESALKSVIGGLSNTYFVGNAPMAHMMVEQTDSSVSSFKVPIPVSPNEFIVFRLFGSYFICVIQFVDSCHCWSISSLHCSI